MARSCNINSRPSDALALAVRAHVPILVAREVLDSAGVTPEEDHALAAETASGTQLAPSARLRRRKNPSQRPRKPASKSAYRSSKISCTTWTWTTWTTPSDEEEDDDKDKPKK